MASDPLLEERRRLDELRRKNSELTTQIFQLVGNRLSVVKEIAGLKRILGEDAENPAVEQELRTRILEESARLNIDPEFASRLLSILLEESVKSQRTTADTQGTTVSARAKEMEQRGEKILHLDMEEPDLSPPPKLFTELTLTAQNGTTQYSSPAGLPTLLDAVKGSLWRKGFEINTRCVLPTLDRKFGIYLAFAALCPIGSEVIQITPAWPGYFDAARAARLRCISLKTSMQDRWIPDLDKLAELISPSTRMIVLNYPNNPTGCILPPSLLDGMVKLARDHNLTIVSDEVYLDYAYAPCESLLKYTDCKKVVVRSFSEQFAIKGFRLGYIISDDDSVSRMTKMLGMQMTSIPESIQYAGAKALEHEEIVRRNSSIMQRRLRSAVEAVQELPLEFVPPEGGFYIFAKLPHRHSDGGEFAAKLLERDKVAVVPGRAFGDYPGHIRLSCCQDESIFRQAISRLGEFLK